MLKRTSYYLNKTLQPGRLIFSKNNLLIDSKSIKNSTNKLILTNPMFDIYYNPIDNLINFNHNKLPNISIAEYLFPYNYGMKLKDLSNDNIAFETNGLIPYRWLQMIKDFHWKDSQIELLNEIDFIPLLKELPKNTFDKIIKDSKSNQSKFGFKVRNSNEKKITGGWYHYNIEYPKNYWGTYDGKFTPYTKKILKKCNEFTSLQSKNNAYEPLYASEGGIEIYTNEQKIFLEFIRSLTGSYINECKGYNDYHTSKNINIEELACLYLALKDQGVPVKKN